MKATESVLIVAMVILILDTGFGVQQSAQGSGTTKVLAIDTSTFDTQVLGALSGIGYTVVSPAVFATTNLLSYDVLYVGSTFQDGNVTVASQQALDALNARKADIAAFVQGGHGIVALTEPIGTGRYAWLPVTVDSFNGYNWGYNDIHIVALEHPVMEDLTDAGLSNWGASGHTYYTDTGSLDTLAVRTSSGIAAIVAGTYGAGRMVLTAQDVDFHYVYGYPGQQVPFLQNAIDWVTPVPAPGAIVLGSIGVSLMGWLRRRRVL